MYTVYIISQRGHMPKYVGYTETSLELRAFRHKHDMYKYINGIGSITCWALYDAMNEIGFDNFEFDPIDYADTEEEADALEEKYITELDTLHPNGYNLTTGGKRGFTCCEASRARKAEGSKQAHANNIDNYRSNALSAGLPMFCMHDRKANAIIVDRHPLCKWKSFKIDDYLTADDAKNACRDFVRNLEAVGQPYVPPEPEYPPGIRRWGDGFKVEKKINGAKFCKNFTKRATLEENLRDAIDYVNEIMQRHNGNN